MNSSKLKFFQYGFLVIASLMSLIAYIILLGGSDLFQWVAAHDGYSHVYAEQSLKSIFVVMAILSLNLLERFQQPHYQLFLSLCLIIALLCAHVSTTNYFIVLAIARTLYVSNQAWIQLYVPPKIRATFTGLILSLTGIIDLRITLIQGSWDTVIIRGEYYRWLLACCFILFCFCVHKLKPYQHPHHQQSTNTLALQEKLARLGQASIKKIKLDLYCSAATILVNPMIFIAFFIGGLNTTIAYYAYAVAKTALPNSPPEFFQYAIYLGLTSMPLFSGRIADKYGIDFVLLVTLVLSMIVIFLASCVPYIEYGHPTTYYVIIFLEAGLANSGYGLAYALLGSRVPHNNLFRAFTLGLLFNYLGFYLYGFIYNHFSHSFSMITLAQGSLNLIGILFFSYFYIRDRKLSTR